MKEDTRRLIIDTASELFYARGYNLVGINEIIEKSGIAKATLYSHFKSKEDLILAYLDKRDTELLENLSKFCEGKPKGHGRLIAVLEFLRQFFEQEDFNGCWCLRTLAEVPSSNTRVREKIKANKNLLLDFIDELVLENAPKWNKGNSKKLSRSLFLLYEASVTESHVQKESWPIDESIDILKLLLKE